MEEDPDCKINTKVKTAVAVLEEGEFLERNGNLTRVFQGRPPWTHRESRDQGHRHPLQG